MSFIFLCFFLPWRQKVVEIINIFCFAYRKWIQNYCQWQVGPAAVAAITEGMVMAAAAVEIGLITAAAAAPSNVDKLV